ncbi:MAG: hypothetical protein UT61_C0023G0004 [Candidatus Woesebacteria bacterium GW2011_GWA1_39_8]|uniref:Glycosyltransferase RgtA/B/C/D-like domain-containing protein n=1 Tax=Candidatus Woesebacteria bacterium GW2011_GWA1_39_8 TaxID=1618552 RepID=A0A0G0SVY7_9BACT|nr:MAG: hypothetical protein UT61_C0023G0004 [Candidatus Woesebacteria bacterium GW2011_GWA1_39_8]
MVFNTIKKHRLAFLLAFIVGAIIVLPTIVSVWKTDPDFKGIYGLSSDDEDFYMALAREVYDGHSNLSNPYIKEYKTGPYMQPPLPEIIYSGAAKLLRISPASLAMVNDFFLPAVSVLLLYSLIWKISQSKKISLLFSGLFFLCFLSAFNRPINPQFGFIFLLAGLNLVWLVATGKYEIKKILAYNISLSVIFGILVYAYPFYWMTIGAVYTLWTFLIAYTEKDFGYWIKNWLSFFVPAVIWSIPFAFNALQLSMSPLFAEASLRFGFINTHWPGAFLNVSLMIFCVPIMYLLQKFIKDRKTVLFGWALVISGIVLNWQNVITGKTLQFPPHFYLVVILFVFLIGAIFLSTVNRDNLSQSAKSSAVLVFMIFIIFAFIFYKQKREILYPLRIISPSNISSLQNMAPVLAWLQDNTPADSAVYILGEGYGWAVPIYTHNSVYFASGAGMSMMSDDELENRWVIQKFFEDVKEKDIRGNRDIWTNKFIDTYQNKESRRKILQLITGRTYPETVLMEQEVIDAVLDKDAKFKKMGFEKALKTYEVDYVLVDFGDERYKNLAGKFKQYTFLSPQAEFNDVSIFKVK